MDTGNDELYFCPPKLTSQYRMFLWNIQDLFIGLFIMAVGFLWLGRIVVAVGALYLVLKAYVTDDKSIYLVLRAIVLYVVSPQTFSQYED